MQLELGNLSSQISSLEVNYSKSRDAYTRFINGRTLNSDFSLWKELDNRFKVNQLVKVSQADFLKGVAVFQKAFWKKYNDKNMPGGYSVKKLNWENKYPDTNKELKEKINSRFPQKEIIGKRLNIINNEISYALDSARSGYNKLSLNLYIQYGLFGAFLIYCFAFYFRRGSASSNENRPIFQTNDIHHYPTILIKLEDDKIISFSGKVKELTPNINDHCDWSEYFSANFSVIKNVGAEKVVSLRRKKTTRYKLQTTINGKYRYISFSPVVTIVKESVQPLSGNDSLRETIRESAFRIELLCPKLKLNINFNEDALIKENLVQRIEESMSMLGTFYKRLSDTQNREILIDASLNVNRSKVKIIFETPNVRLDPNVMKNISNFNFSFYPQKVESILADHEGAVTLKNKYSVDKKFVASIFEINFDLGKAKYKVSRKNDNLLELLIENNSYFIYFISYHLK